MITTVADLLKAFSDAENEKLKEQDIKHPPTIGTMYEGLTADILQKSLFSGLNLVVAKSSFIKGSYTEFDIILSEGVGEVIPHTEKYIFEPQQVLAVIQVKKSFNAKDLKDSYENLMRIPDLYEGIQPEEYMQRLASDSIHHTLQKSVTDYKNGLFSKEEEYVYHTLVIQAMLPITIAIGYNGLKSEYSLRNKFYEYLDTKKSTVNDFRKGYTPNNFPNLVICENNSIIKLAGSPFNTSYKECVDGWWDFTASSHYNPLYFFLEGIWTKLSYKYGLPSSIFGEDLDTPAVVPFLSCKINITNDEAIGWDYLYHDIPKNKLQKNNGMQEWHPVFLNEIQWRVFNLLCVDETFEFSEVPNLEKDALEYGYDSIDELIESLCDTGLVAVANQKLVLITRGCETVMIGDRYLVAENNSGRFDNWLMKHGQELMFGNRE